MIESVTMYRVRCDRCGKDSCKDSEHVAWSDEDQAWFVAADIEWEATGGKHYCPSCYVWDEIADAPAPLPPLVIESPGGALSGGEGE